MIFKKIVTEAWGIRKELNAGVKGFNWILGITASRVYRVCPDQNQLQPAFPLQDCCCHIFIYQASSTFQLSLGPSRRKINSSPFTYCLSQHLIVLLNYIITILPLG